MHEARRREPEQRPTGAASAGVPRRRARARSRARTRVRARGTSTRCRAHQRSRADPPSDRADRDDGDRDHEAEPDRRVEHVGEGGDEDADLPARAGARRLRRRPTVSKMAWATMQRDRPWCEPAVPAQTRPSWPSTRSTAGTLETSSTITSARYVPGKPSDAPEEHRDAARRAELRPGLCRDPERHGRAEAQSHNDGGPLQHRWSGRWRRR